MMTTIEELLIERAAALFERLGIPHDFGTNTTQYRKALLRALGGPYGGLDGELATALMTGVTPHGKSALKGKADAVARGLNAEKARLKAAVAAGDAEQTHAQGSFYYLHLDDGSQVPVTNGTRAFLGLKALSSDRAKHAIHRDARGDLIVDLNPRPADRFAMGERLAKREAQIDREEFQHVQDVARLRGRAAAMRAHEDPTQVARISQTGALIPAPDDLKAIQEADARRRRMIADRDQEAAEDARRLNALDDARHEQAVREHLDRAKRIGF